MCLYTKQTEPEVAEEDIICYKFYMIYNHGVLFSPYQGFRAPEIGVVTNTELGKPYKPEESNFYIHNFYVFIIFFDMCATSKTSILFIVLSFLIIPLNITLCSSQMLIFK